jgi:hypothetical protein
MIALLVYADLDAVDKLTFALAQWTEESCPECPPRFIDILRQILAKTWCVLRSISLYLTLFLSFFLSFFLSLFLSLSLSLFLSFFSLSLIYVMLYVCYVYFKYS